MCWKMLAKATSTTPSLEPFYKGKDGIKVMSRVAYQRRFIQWAPLGEGTGAPVAIYAPGEAMPKTKRSTEDNKDYVEDGSGQYIEETHQHYVLVLHEDGQLETALSRDEVYAA